MKPPDAVVKRIYKQESEATATILDRIHLIETPPSANHLHCGNEPASWSGLSLARHEATRLSGQEDLQATVVFQPLSQHFFLLSLLPLT